jgi:hypothetical protein
VRALLAFSLGFVATSCGSLGSEKRKRKSGRGEELGDVHTGACLTHLLKLANSFASKPCASLLTDAPLNLKPRARRSATSRGSE